MDARAVVLYDAECGFCRWALGVLLRWDRRGRLRPMALQSAEAGRLLRGTSVEERMGSLHVVEGGVGGAAGVGDAAGDVASAGAALVALARVLPGGAVLAAVGERAPGAVELGYRLVAGHRSGLGRLVTAGARRRADAVIARRGED